MSRASSFENFMHTKFVGQKRFSLEGNETLISSVNEAIKKGASLGVKQVVIGMAHRGRLNVLANIFGKPSKLIFSEFEGKDYCDIETGECFDGDVKYHLGWTCTKNIDGTDVNLNLVPNPSHLETVAPVTIGICRAKQEKHYQNSPSSVLPIIIHGDAAIAGQGIVYETTQMSGLKGYTVQGSIHIVVNNQVGFTTNYTDSRTSTYCTDIAKVINAPVLHVNADDVEAVVCASQFAIEYRMRFNKDIFIDLLGYRKYGHNEGDEPKFTQPKLYSKISKHPNVTNIYNDKLVKANIISNTYLAEFEREYNEELDKNLTASKEAKNAEVIPFMQDEWESFNNSVKKDSSPTAYNLESLNNLSEKLTHLNFPSDKKFIKKIVKLFEGRHKSYFEKDQIDWGMGELLAYATLIEEGHNVRISGQDVQRGTFSHRHAVIKTEDTEEEFSPLNTISDISRFYAYNSLLSEYGVLGFEYGYAMTTPNDLIIWEAQFGDFSNGAQILIDQYVSSAENKWQILNGVVMLLPHGYEGQGPEHSSARMERYLQLCASDNMVIADCTTPANYFHLLRKQLKDNKRKPLVVFTPKSLLRHPLVLSKKQDFIKGQFQTVLDDPFLLKSKKEVKTVVLCTGKFFYDLVDERKKIERDDVALVRLEQLYPFPNDEIKKILKTYPNANDIVWAQEEPKNMGAYAHVLVHMEDISFRLASMKAYAGPAAGSPIRAKKRHKIAIDKVFNKNMI